MNGLEHAAARVAAAHKLGRPTVRWIATEAVAAELGLNGELHGLPGTRGKTRFGLELVCPRPASAS